MTSLTWDPVAAERRREDWMLLGGLTLITFVLHVAFYKGYGFFRDELYFIACSRHRFFRAAIRAAAHDQRTSELLVVGAGTL